MAEKQTMLQYLQSRSAVDIDCLDVEVAKALGPFVDCTSNQAIAFFELEKPNHKSLIQDSIKLSQALGSTFPDINPAELAAEIAMVKLGLIMTPYIKGNILIQVNPYNAYSTTKIVANARRIVKHFQVLSPTFDHNRVCIKIPSTWAGLQACGILEKEKIKNLATTLFTMEQAALAAEVGAGYIAPYVNELKVHFVPGFIDTNKAGALCARAQRMYRKHNIETKVMPASLTEVEEIYELVGVDHITISPVLLHELAVTPVKEVKSLFDATENNVNVDEWVKYGADESKWRMAFTRSEAGDGEGERKLVQAINTFCNMQDKLELLMK